MSAPTKIPFPSQRLVDIRTTALGYALDCHVVSESGADATTLVDGAEVIAQWLLKGPENSED